MADSKNPFDPIVQKPAAVSYVADADSSPSAPNPFDPVPQKYSPVPVSAAPNPFDPIATSSLIQRHMEVKAPAYTPAPRPFGGVPVPTEEGESAPFESHTRFLGAESLTPRPSNPFDPIAPQRLGSTATAVAPAPTVNPFDPIQPSVAA